MKVADMPDVLSYHFNEDFKAEVVAAEMVEAGTPIEQILIRMLGSLKRTYRKDIESVEEVFSEVDYTNYTIINTPKEGLYDMLPEGLFHSVSLHQSLTSQNEIIKIIKLHREEEESARRFFSPFEMAINHLRIELALYENRLDKSAHYPDFADIFADNWEIFNYMDAVQANIFVQLLPIIHDLRDNYPMAETIFELILQLPVRITAARRKPILIDNPAISTMDDCALGVNMTTGNVLFDDGEDEISIKIGPMNKTQLQKFMPGTKQSKVFELLCDYLLPVHLDVATEFELLDADKICILADGDDADNSVMGFSTYL